MCPHGAPRNVPRRGTAWSHRQSEGPIVCHCRVAAISDYQQHLKRDPGVDLCLLRGVHWRRALGPGLCVNLWVGGKPTIAVNL